MNKILLKTILPLLVILHFSSAQAEQLPRLTPNYLFSDMENMLSELDMAANQGDVQAQITLGLFYLTGITSADGSISIPKDIDIGKAWFMRAIDSGSMYAMGVLAQEYAEGTNLPRDDNEADRWFMKAIAQGGPEAKIAMLERYEKGLSIPVDDREVTRLIVESANYGHLDSQIKAAGLFLDDQSDARDLVKAYKWMALAVKAKPDNTDWITKLDDITAQMSQRQLLVSKAKVEKWQPKGHSDCDNPKVAYEFYRLD